MSDPAVHESFLVHRGLKYFKLALLIVVAAVVAYIWHRPLGAPNGGTWLGYTLGGLSAAIVLWLTWFGVRKRQYALGATRLKAWLSAHVYLGLALVVLTTLHTGFQVGWNIHTAAYAMVLLTVASGIFGIYVYARYPRLMTANRAGLTLNGMMTQIAELDQEIRESSKHLPQEVSEALLRAAQETCIGGGIFRKLSGRDPACPTGKAQRLMETKYAETGIDDPNIGKVIALLVRKSNLLRRARRDVQIQAILRIWLFFHVPLAVGLLGTLCAHVLAVFFYW
jgi:hypothetical protein